MYKEAIKKQEKVIGKLERVMSSGMSEVKQAQQTKLELEELKKRSMGHGRACTEHTEEIARLQRIIAESQRNQKGGVQFSNVSNNSNANNYELEFKLHQAETRIESL